MNRHAFVILLVIGLVRSTAAEDIAANEREAAAACIAFAEAEEIYRRTDYDTDGVLEYAQSIRGGSRAPAPAPDAGAFPKPSDAEREKIEKLIAEFGSDSFNTREKAGHELHTLGPKAYAQVSAAVKTQRDPEIVQRCIKTARQIMESLAPPQPAALQSGLYKIMRNGLEMELSLVDKALANAECPAGADPKSATPRAGYLFRVLTRQGAAATGGARSYLTGNNMTLGYGLLAFPADYGRTGKEVFIINNNGTIFRRDFGDNDKTEAYVKDCIEFNPTAGDWTPTEWRVRAP